MSEERPLWILGAIAALALLRLAIAFYAGGYHIGIR